ncbi:unnamed protein product, partial [Protopolystoma xenopodis]
MEIQSFHNGVINVHPSLLPRWRGASPISHALAANDRISGVTIIQIPPKKGFGIDSGYVLLQRAVSLDCSSPVIQKGSFLPASTKVHEAPVSIGDSCSQVFEHAENFSSRYPLQLHQKSSTGVDASSKLHKIVTFADLFNLLVAL